MKWIHIWCCSLSISISHILKLMFYFISVCNVEYTSVYLTLGFIHLNHPNHPFPFWPMLQSFPLNTQRQLVISYYWSPSPSIHNVWVPKAFCFLTEPETHYSLIPYFFIASIISIHTKSLLLKSEAHLRQWLKT